MSLENSGKFNKLSPYEDENASHASFLHTKLAKTFGEKLLCSFGTKSIFAERVWRS
jgi:hypothetical protein